MTQTNPAELRQVTGRAQMVAPSSRTQVLREIARSRHVCVREILQVTLPTRWGLPAALEGLCRQWGHNRLHLPVVDIETLLPGFADTTVSISQVPRGSWSTPVSDQVLLAKLAKVSQAKNLLEVGSFRGFTARMLAENLTPDGVLNCVDVAIDHGEAYRDHPLASRVRRHVGSADEILKGALRGQTFDLIFLDANHQLEAVRQDSALLLPLLADSGLFVWHDYADWGWLNRWNRVPEVLAEMAGRITIVSIPGSSLAVHSGVWSPELVRRAQEHWRLSRRSSP